MLDTFVQTGQIPIRLGPPKNDSKESTVLEKGKPRETREFNGKLYSMETAITGDVAILRAWKVDEEGNCQFRYVLLKCENQDLQILDSLLKLMGYSWLKQPKWLL